MFSRFNCCNTGPSHVRGNSPPPSSSAQAAAPQAITSAESRRPAFFCEGEQGVSDPLCLGYVTQEDMRQGRARMLPCNHVFHSSCIDDLITNTRDPRTGLVQCPIDRESFKLETQAEMDEVMSKAKRC